MGNARYAEDYGHSDGRAADEFWDTAPGPFEASGRHRLAVTVREHALLAATAFRLVSKIGTTVLSVSADYSQSLEIRFRYASCRGRSAGSPRW